MIELDLERLQPLRLSTGTHDRGSGKGCAMNVISWENGDTEITDLPDCSDPFLALIVQWVNDSICRHHRVDEPEMLCSDCAVPVLELAHRTVGTRLEPTIRREMVYFDVALHTAEQVMQTAPGWLDQGMFQATIAVLRGWRNGRYTVEHLKRLRSELNSGLTHMMPSGMVNTAGLASMLIEAAPEWSLIQAGGDSWDRRGAKATVEALRHVGVGGDVPLRDVVIPFVHQVVFDKFMTVTGVTPYAPDMDRIACAVRDMAVVGA